MNDLGDSSLTSWIQAGGVALFALSVLWELRQLRPVMKQTAEVLVALLERERMRSEQRARLIQMQQANQSAQAFDDVTDAVAMPIQRPKKRAPSQPRGYPIGAYGPMKPQRDDDDDGGR